MRVRLVVFVTLTILGLVQVPAMAEDPLVTQPDMEVNAIADTPMQTVSFATELGGVQKGDDGAYGCCDAAGKYGSDNCCGYSQCCDPCCECRWYLFPQFDRLRVRGWLNAGIIGNTDSPASKFNGPYNAVDRSNEAMMNQAYLVSEFLLPTDGSLGLGARFDLMYGEDFLLAQSTGWETYPSGAPKWNTQEYYGLATPQAYIEAGTNELSVKIGHFYTPIGYEGVPAPNNFFYSKSYSYQFAGPFTHWGGLMTWKPNDCWQVQLGLHNGWDALDRQRDHMGVLAGIKYTNPYSGWWTSFAITTGDETNDLAGLLPPPAVEFTNRTRYSWLVSLPLTCRLEYVFHHWLGFQNHGALDGETALWYGIDQYLLYKINCNWKAGLRVEWFCDEDGTRVGLNRPSNPNTPPLQGDYLSLSFGLNWKPTSNLVIRPEIRADFYDGPAAPFNDGLDDSQLMIGIDGILKF